MKYYKQFKYFILLFVNVLLASLLIKPIFIDPTGSSNTIFCVIVIFVMLIYNLYAMILNHIKSQQKITNKYYDSFFLFLYLCPLIILVYLVLK